MKWRQAVPTSVTILAMLCGFFSILYTIEGMRNGLSEFFRWAALMIMLSMILDGLDGNLARWLKGESEFGAELDTYVDMTAFGIAPAVLIFAVALQSQQADRIWRVVLPSAVAVSGMVRLARFKVKDPLRGQAGYSGLPITVNAGWVAMFVFISMTKPIETYSLNHSGWMATMFLLGIVSFTFLQVSNLRYPKPTKNVALYSLCAVLVIGLLCLSIFEDLGAWAVRLATVMIVLGVGYILFGPLFVKGVAAHRARKQRKSSSSVAASPASSIPSSTSNTGGVTSSNSVSENRANDNRP
jgi:CDP-diacylglycerol---serine O-phosphatidyltransferase